MTTKNRGKTPSEPQASFGGPAPEDMRAAYEIHTLAQMMYGQMARTNPWGAQQPPTMGPTPYVSHPQTQWAQQWPTAPWNPWAAWWGR